MDYLDGILKGYMPTVLYHADDNGDGGSSKRHTRPSGWPSVAAMGRFGTLPEDVAIELLHLCDITTAAKIKSCAIPGTQTISAVVDE